MIAQEFGEATYIEDLLAMSSMPGPTAVAIGVFDGVHLGHQALLSELCRRASQTDAAATALTFVRHPADVLAPGHAPKHICSLEERVKLLREACPGIVIVARFDHKLAALSPKEFVEEILVVRLRASSVVVGPNFRFGKGRTGDVHLLTDLASRSGIAVVVAPVVRAYDRIVSSTRIRRLVEAGDVEMAAKLLGKPFAVSGRVVEGEGIGRQLGFPTANLDTEQLQLVPKPGVYTADALVRGQSYRAAANIDMRPSLRPDTPLIEVHLVDFEGDVYGEPIRVEFKRRLRDKIRFPDRQSLIRQIAADVETAAREPSGQLTK